MAGRTADRAEDDDQPVVEHEGGPDVEIEVYATEPPASGPGAAPTPDPDDERAPESTTEPPPPPRMRGPWRKRRVRTPSLLQMEAVECGAASLGIVLGYHGRYVPLERLRTDCGVSRDGSNAANVLDAGEQYGMVVDGFRMELGHLDTVKLPCIIFWEFNHFLVLEGLSRHQVHLNDPAFGRRSVSIEEFDRSFSGLVLTLEPGETFEKGGRRPSVVRSLAHRLSGIRLALTFCILAGLGLVIPGLAIPAFTRIFVDDILLAGATNWLAPLLLGLAIAAVLRASLTAIQLHFLRRSSTKLAIATSGRFMWHVMRLPVEFFMQRYAGEVSSRVQSNGRVASALTGDLATSVIGMVTAVFYAALMVSYDWLLAVIGIVLSMLNIVLLRLIARRRADESQRMLQESGKLVATAMGGIQCIESIKASARESDFFARWAGHQAKASVAAQRLSASGALLDVIPIGLRFLAAALVLGIGGFRVMDGTLTIGLLVAFQTLLVSFSRPMQDLVRLGQVIQRLTGDVKRLDDVQHYELDPAFTRPDRPLADVAARRLTGELELRNVTFGYNRLDDPLLHEFSLKLTPGDRVALVGKSGSGKSTIAKLITGLYPAWSGEILFDGVPRENIRRDLLANSCAVVDQDLFFFEGSVRENIALWDSTLPDEAIQRAAKDACIHEDIAARRGAYSSIVEEGGRNFSGGQRQRLEIARALAIEPTVIVLDEATSALDAATEKMVDDHIRRRGCTCVIVAHRLSTIRDCNEIIVLEYGKVVQRGTHEELIDVDGPYQRLIRSE